MKKKIGFKSLALLLFPVVFYLFCSVITTFPLVFQMRTAVYGPFFGTDIRGTVWSLWWIKYTAAHYLDYNSCDFLAYPIGLDFTSEPIFGIAAFYTRLIVILTDPVFFLNFSTLLCFILSGIFAYLLVLKLTKNRWVSLFCGFIFAFCPYHLNKAMEFSYNFLGNWIALYALALILLKERLTFWRVLLVVFAFSMTMAFNIYYAFVIFVFTCGFLVFCFFYQWRVKLLLLRFSETRQLFKMRFDCGLAFLFSMCYVLAGVLLVNAPTFIKLIRNIFFSVESLERKTSMGYVRNFDYLFAQSARPLSYLLPASTHPLFGRFTQKMFGSVFYGRGSIEQTLYLGVLPLALACVAVWQWRKKRLFPAANRSYLESKENFYVGFFLFSAIVAFIFSMPPFLDIGLFKVYLPSFFFYKILPMLRAYARFGIMVMLAVVVLAGYGLKHVLGKFKNHSATAILMSVCFFISIFEFMNFPPLRVTKIERCIPPVYGWLCCQNDDVVIAEYPMVLAVSSEAAQNYDYLFYQTKHHKRMINGATAGTKAFDVKKEILRVDFPESAGKLKFLGVKYVIFHSNLYKRGEFRESVEIRGVIPDISKNPGYKLVKKFGNDYVYEVVADPIPLDSSF